MFCNKCGQQIPDDSVFCSKCGRRVSAAGSTTDTNPSKNQYTNPTGGSTPVNPWQVLYEKNLWARVTSFRQTTGKFTLTASGIIFKPMLSSAVEIPYSTIASASRTSHMMVNPNALLIMTKSGEKHTFIPSQPLTGKVDVEAALDIILKHIQSKNQVM